MTNETEQGIRAGGIHFENPTREKVPDAVVTITISRKRFELIQSGVGVVAASSVESGEDPRKLLEFGYNAANILMPSLIDHVLKEALTSRQYQRALRTNQEGEFLKFAKS